MGPNTFEKIDVLVRASALQALKPLLAPDAWGSGGDGSFGGRARGSRAGAEQRQTFSPEELTDARRVLNAHFAVISEVPVPLKITPAIYEILRAKNKPKEVSLGAVDAEDVKLVMIENFVGDILSALRNSHSDKYLLVWNGSKVPRGAMLETRSIAWTQHGMVNDSYGEKIGFYERLVEFGGSDKKLQVMIVSTSPESLKQPEPPVFTNPPVGTMRINSLEDTFNRAGEIVAYSTSPDNRHSWNYFVIPSGAREMAQRGVSYLGHSSFPVTYINFDCSSSVTERTFLHGVMRTITPEEFETVKAMPRFGKMR